MPGPRPAGASGEATTATGGVKPLDWARAVTDSGLLRDGLHVQAVVPVLTRYAPGAPHKGRGWAFFLSVDRVIHHTGVSASTVKRGFRTLAEAGWVERVSRGGGVNAKASEYRLTRPASPASLADEATPPP